MPGAPGTVGIWDVATGRRVGKPLAIGSADVDAGDLRRRRPDADRERRRRRGVHGRRRNGRRVGPPLSVGNKPAGSLDLSPDGRLLAVGFVRGPVFVWDTKTGTPYGSPLTADTSPVNDVVFSPDGRTLRELAPAFGGRLEHERRPGDRKAAWRHRRTSPPTCRSARRAGGPSRAAGWLRDRLRHGTLGAAQSGSASAWGGHRRRLATSGGRLIDCGDDRWEGSDLRSDERGGRRPPPRFGKRRRSGRSPSAPTADGLAVAVDPNGEAGFSGKRQGEVQLWQMGFGPASPRNIAPGAGRAPSLSLQPRRHAARDRQ